MAKPKAKIREAYDGYPFVVIAKKAMHRGGRHWPTGVHEFLTEEQRKAAGLEDDEATDKMLQKLEVYPQDFDIKKAEPPKVEKTGD